MISVAFVDDHPVLLSGLCQLFAGSEEFKVVAVGRSAGELVAVAANTRPDVIVADLTMPGSVLEAIARIANEGQGIKILTFTASGSIDTAISVLEAGASGYVLKGSTLDELAEAIRQVHAGETYITPSVATKVVAGLRERARGNDLRRVVFSRREEQVLRLLLKGRTNREIADALVISEKTVKHYMSVLMQKLNARNRLEVVLAAQSLAQMDGQAMQRSLN